MQENIIIHSDNLPILQSLSDASIDLVYADPPFNTCDSWAGGKGGYTDIYKDPVAPPSGLEWIDEVFDSKSRAYSSYMSHRLIEIHRVLKPKGHFFLHCDWRESAHLQVLVNWIFGKARFKNEIIWVYPKSYSADQYSSVISYFSIAHNSILWWERSSVASFNPLFEPFTLKQIREFFHHRTADGRRFRTRAGKGRTRYFADEAPGIPMTDVWQLPIASKSERTGYPTQKPMSLLNRIIKCASKTGDLVLDPFCGAGTALLSARNLNRRYLGIDINDEAVALANRRLGRSNHE